MKVISYNTLHLMLSSVFEDRDKISSKDSNIDEGKHVTLTCDSHNRAEWTFNEHKLPQNVKVVSNTSIQITYFSKLNEGTYECKGRTDEGYLFFAPVKLRIISKYYKQF